METTVNERVKKLRTSMNLTQSDFAQLVGITVSQLSRIENGIGDPQNKTLTKILEQTGTTKQWLFNGEGAMSFSIGEDIDEDFEYRKDETFTWKGEAYHKLETQNTYLQTKLNEAMAIINGLAKNQCS